jgi:hypothetical protein
VTALPPGAGAAQVALLDLVERDGPVDEGLARLVLTTPATGRGRVDLPLDTDDVPVDELQRVATGVLARLVDRWEPPADAPARVRTRFFARRFRVHGSPATARSVHDTLTSAGLVEGDYRTAHLVVALPLEQMVSEHWVRQVADGSGRSWRRLWRMLELADRLPPRVDVPTVARRLSRDGARVEVVVAGTPAAAVAQAASALGVSAPPRLRADPDPVVVDLRRRLNLLRGGRAPDPLDDWCPSAAGPALAAPAARLPWLRRRADELARRLRDADYPVHGDPAEAAQALGGEVRRGIDPAATLDMTVHAIRAGWQSLRAEVS